MTKTAVDWLINEIDRLEVWDNQLALDVLIQQANEMFRQQMIESFNQGMNNSIDYFDPTDETPESHKYYNETYGK